MLAHGRPAGIVTRGAANLVDIVLVVLAVGLGYAGWVGLRFLLAPTSFRPTAPTYGWVLAAFALGLFVYWATAWAGPGRSKGAQLLGLRVTDRRGARLSPWRAAVRAALCVVFLPGLLWVLISRRNRSVQDVLLRTSVVYD
ncbi:RDD family protein [Nakamurella leprariae]|uniref:RDD family protein n=1 Tax=Nakamurella leprariae TaxID=2803911 RepID=A0A938YEQ6_9ACTN|nr:RDD family protein [Nakamurella leprariae]MBM9469352.1 RDD family protein [Nakamurella leprariae]